MSVLIKSLWFVETKQTDQAEQFESLKFVDIIFISAKIGVPIRLQAREYIGSAFYIPTGRGGNI
jgi:hypothetical protein